MYRNGTKINMFQKQRKQYELMVKTAIKCLIWFLGSQCDVVSRSLSTNETVWEDEAGTGEKSQDCELESQSAGGELSIDRQLFHGCIFTCPWLQLSCFVEMFLKDKVLVRRTVPWFPPLLPLTSHSNFLPRFCKVCLFSRLFNAGANIFPPFLGRGGDYQAKLRNTVVNDERPFVRNERKTNFTAGRNRGAEERQA